MGKRKGSKEDFTPEGSKNITTLAPEVVKAEEERFKPKLVRSHSVFVQRLKASVTREELEKALATRDIRKVMALYSTEKINKLLGPMKGILVDATTKAGKAAAKGVNNEANR